MTCLMLHRNVVEDKSELNPRFFDSTNVLSSLICYNPGAENPCYSEYLRTDRTISELKHMVNLFEAFLFMSIYIYLRGNIYQLNYEKFGRRK